jgi:lysozyme family protein
MKGVTQDTYDAFLANNDVPTRDVRQISDSEVDTIYFRQYWKPIRAYDLPDGVAYCTFDAAVNSGPEQAAKWLQRAVGAQVDGIVGEQTLALVHESNPEAVIDDMCDLRLAFMKRLDHWPTFAEGWSERVAEVRAQSKEWAKTDDVQTVTRKAPQQKAQGRPKRVVTRNEKLAAGAAAGAGATGVAGMVADFLGPAASFFGQLAPIAQLVGVALAGVLVLYLLYRKVD